MLALKPFILPCIILFAWLFLPFSVERFTQLSFNEFQAPSLVASSYLKDLQVFWAKKSRSNDELIETAKELQRIVNRYRVYEQQNESLRTEVARLDALLSLPAEPEYRVELARVIRRDINSFWNQIIIRKGSNYNIPVGAAVISKDGVVGKVREVYAYTAVIELISSPQFRMVAQFDGDDRPVTYQGKVHFAMATAEGIVRDVPPDIRNLAKPVRLVSSSLGGTFPDGLTIGYISKFEQASNGFFLEAPVNLSDHMLRLEEVAVLIPLKINTGSGNTIR